MMQNFTKCIKVLRGCCVQVICAGSLDTFQIFVWATKTGRLLDVLAAHEAPVVALAFSPAQPLLASGSWDKTVRTWDVFRCPAAAPRTPKFTILPMGFESCPSRLKNFLKRDVWCGSVVQLAPHLGNTCMSFGMQHSS